ncbi:MAG: S41 family peptidase [Parachlamydiales bacterium]|jgi:carboxyl-terminal processing protease
MLRWKFLFHAFILSSLPFFCHADQDLLKTSDVQKVMQELLQRHVEKKEVSPELLQNAVRAYIEQFDSGHVYLLEQEVKPFVYLSPTELSALKEDYAKGDFSLFKKIDVLFVRAIERARSVRKELYATPDTLFTASSQAAKEALEGSPVLPFATSPAALKERNQNELIAYIRSQMRRFGAADVLNQKKSVLANYEDEARTHENPYLFEDIEGKPLVASAKENIFTIHVLKAFATILDAHTSVFNPEEAYDMRVRLEKQFNGVGIIVRKKPDGVFVERILRDSPAAKQGGIEPGDRLVEINGRSAYNIPYEELQNLLRGDRAQKVTLTLKKTGELIDKTSPKTYTVRLEPAMITVNDDRVEISYVPYGNGIIGTITLKAFYKGANGVTSEKDVSDAIKKLDKIGNLKGLVLDLRGNSGGFLTQAVKVAGLFITNGVVVISKYSTGEEHFYRDMDGKTSYNGPLVVLTSKTTASAAEIVAQALQDYGVAVVVGDPQTFGKGTIQSQTITGGEQSPSYFKVTVGKYYTVSGRTPQLDGVKADITAPSELSYEEIGEEYLEDVIPADKILASFSDQLADVDPQMKPWYLRYYVPSLQQQENKWRTLIPELRRNSLARIQTNNDYQRYLTALSVAHQQKRPFKENVAPLHELQHQEAINVVKDMVDLDSTLKSN